MELEDQRRPVAPYNPAAEGALPAGTSTADRHFAMPVTSPFLRLLWRYRVLLIGVTTIVLAVLGEELMRTRPANSLANPELGAHLMQIAVILVGLVAWVRDGWAIGRASEQEKPLATSPQVETGSAGFRQPLTARFTAVRMRLGWRGTAVGGVVVLALAVWLYLLLKQSFLSDLALYVWLAILVGLALTFVGVRPWPSGAGLLAHDPTEPAQEPPMSRGEWLLIGAIMLAAIILRIWNLENIPVGPYTDEADRAVDARHLNRGEPVNRETFVFFGTGWWGVPSLYFWSVAQSLKVFGDNLYGARMIHAIAGIFTIWFTYRTGRIVWSPRVGLIAAALIAVSDFAIQFSRTAGESTTTMLTWIVCIYYLYKALKYRRPLDFVLCGLGAGLTQYGYVSGKLLPVFLIFVAVYLLLRWGWTGLKLYLPGLALVAITALLVYAPNGLFVLTQKPTAFTERYNGVAIFAPQNQATAFQTYQTNNWPTVLADQFGLSFAAFDVGQEKGPFYPTGQPILPVPWAALWLLGTAYIVWRAGDARYALLGLWLLSGLAGAALTNDTPTLQRVTGMVPLLGLIPALYLDRIAGGLPPMRRQLRLPLRQRVLRWAVNLAIAILVMALGVQTVSYYFGPYTAQGNYAFYSLAGRYAATLNPDHDAIYQMDVPEFGWSTNANTFPADKVTGRDLANPSQDLPLTDNGHKNTHFLVFPSNNAYLAVLQDYYLGGTQSVVNKPDGTPFFTDYTVSSTQFDQARQVMARYGPAGSGPFFERPEPRLGTLGDAPDAETVAASAPITYPTSAQWAGGLVVPVYGTYALSLSAPEGATFQIDGRSLLTVAAGSNAPAAVRLVLARGVHSVILAGPMSRADAKIELRWGSDGGALEPVGRQFLWNGSLGSLFGEAYPATGDPALMAAQQVPTSTLSLRMARRDSVLGWRSINSTLAGDPGALAVWTGTLLAPTAGSYAFAVNTGAQASVWLDGKLVGLQAIPGGQPAFPASVNLTAGQHSFQLRFQTQQDGSMLELYWQPPGQAQQSIIPPSAFTTADGGAWLAAEMPGVPGPDPAMLTPLAPAPGDNEP